MLKHIFVLICGVALLAMLTGPALAQDVSPQHTDPNWQVAYWNNMNLSGPPVLQRTDTNLDFNWGTGSPGSGVNTDQFSARWTRYIDVPPGNYTITVTADDGIRVWIDEQLLIDQWREQSATTYSAQTYLGSGHHLVRVEYFDRFGDAVVRVSYNQGSQPPPPPPPPTIYNWRGEYFNNKSLSGPPAAVRDDPRIDFSWGGSPIPGVIDADGFSVRWSQSLNLPPGNYRFTLTVDDGARLFVNGHLLIDAWKDQSPRNYVGDIYLPGGAITVQMEYYENTGGAVARLDWNSGSQPPPPPPPSPPPAGDAYGLVTAYKLNVRSGPSLYYPVMGWLYRGEQVRLVGRNSAGTWFRVEGAYNFRGWVNAYYVRSSVPPYRLPIAEY